MSPTAQRIAIAEACGWRRYNGDTGWRAPGGAAGHFPPYYPRDLNAMHEAEKVLTPAQAGRYRDNLAESAGRAYDYPASYLVACATAAQRAEAFLRAIGKWEDES